MKTLYLDCSMGAAGDMLSAALIELLPEPDAFISEMNALDIPDVQITKEASVKCGITGTHISVKVDGTEENEEMYHHHDHAHSHEQEPHHHEHLHEEESHNHGHSHEEESHRHGHSHDATRHHHSGMHDIETILAQLPLSESVKNNALAVYQLIAEAESHVHGVPVTKIHFHEVGTKDAIADIVSFCLLMDKLSPDEMIVSPVHVGSGQVKCAHGILPVPAPATAYILKDVPVYGGQIKGELCTPTGAALLKHFATRFGDMPVMKMQAIGYGMGKKDFAAANCVRAILGESEDRTDTVLELSCNVDDMTAEAVGFAAERLFEGGALEVYTIPIGMKKSRPGTLIRVICAQENKERIISLLFQYTTTIGIRETATKRYVLNRGIETLDTPYGKVRRKDSSGYGVTRSKYEYEDLANIAKERNISLSEVQKLIEESLKN
ncbi:MAG: nickel pincer cofactor biosynthesis protein LarC [Blautia sp.]|nr:nickel pincer cofactor biosynthesis protein LarC [Lachnoclostridium sp.]MCM1211333.1 nickel pincer cofactor biosynthesis protein LarC [Blautia sp.]